MTQQNYTGPTVQELADQFETSGEISSNDAALLRANALFLETHRPSLQKIFAGTGKWIAAIDGNLYSGPSLREVKDLISAVPNSSCGCIEQIF